MTILHSVQGAFIRCMLTYIIITINNFILTYCNASLQECDVTLEKNIGGNNIMSCYNGPINLINQLIILDWYFLINCLPQNVNWKILAFRTNPWYEMATLKGASTRSYTRLIYLVLLYVYDLLSLAHVQKYVCVYEYDVLQPCWIFLYVVHVYDAQMFELAVFIWAYYHRWRFKSKLCFTRYTQ